MEEKNPLIAFEKADILNGESPVLYGLDLKIYPGDFVYIVGKVGTGKTSIIRTIIAENPLEKGRGMVCGFNLRKLKTKEIPLLRRKLGVVFQDFQLLMDRSVEDNLLFVLKATGWKDKGLMEKRIAEVLGAVGMEHKARQMPYRLSGGEQQRIAIARSILNRPKVIVSDEPTGNLDPETADGIMNLLKKINTERGTAIVMVTHNMNLCWRFPGRMMVCKDGRCTERESARTITIDFEDIDFSGTADYNNDTAATKADGSGSAAEETADSGIASEETAGSVPMTIDISDAVDDSDTAAGE